MVLPSLREGGETMAVKRQDFGKVGKRSSGGGKRASSLEDRIEMLIGRCVDAIEKEETRVSVSDLIRLRKLRDEMSPKKTVVPDVTWVEGWERVAPRRNPVLGDESEGWS